jgi:hypothetical protein
MADRHVDLELLIELARNGDGELLADVMRRTLRCPPVLLDFLVGVVVGEIILKGPRDLIVDELRRTFGIDAMVGAVVGKFILRAPPELIAGVPLQGPRCPPVLLDFLVGVFAGEVKLRPARALKYLTKVESWGRARFVAHQVEIEMRKQGKQRDSKHSKLREVLTEKLCKVYGSKVTDVEKFRKDKYKGEPRPAAARAAEIAAAKRRKSAQKKGK